MFDYASGDRDPDDDGNERFDTLYGARGFDYGPTGIYGALARSNLKSPALRLELELRRDVKAAATYRPAWLASDRDRWTTTAIRDPSGSSGSFIGHQLDGVVEWEILPGNLALEAGLAYLRLGAFPKRAPNGDPDAGDPLYGYFQLSLSL